MRLRLILSFVLVGLVSILSVVLIVSLSTAREVHTFMFGGGMTGIDELVGTLEDYYSQHQTWQGVDTLMTNSPHGMMGRGGMGGMMNQRLRLADAQGNLVFDTQNPRSAGSLDGEEIQAAIPITYERRTVGYLLAEGGANFGPQDQTNLLRRLTRAAQTAALLSGGLSLLLAFLLADRLARPVQDLTGAAQSLAAGDLSRRVPVRGDRELATLGKAFNHMAESLQQAEQSRRDMTADIAHELRTPLAVQRAHLEAIQDGVYPLSIENLDPILEQNHLLTRLVDDLRTLALAEAGRLALDLTQVDFAALVRRVVERFQPQTNSRQVEIHLTEPGVPLPEIRGDPARIEQIITNLLTNGIRYTPAGGSIEISLDGQVSDHVQLTVHDSGPGISPEALPHIFERFYRADPSRSREAGGTGIGLAIALQLAQAHGGTLSASNHPKGGAVFTLTLPA
ncbi:MAG: HAMP domain-containing protein [Chloroflexota bacterium]|nr:MAG: HAMP domain-containing protein [Chloroflexota bacterium]